MGGGRDINFFPIKHFPFCQLNSLLLFDLPLRQISYCLLQTLGLPPRRSTFSVGSASEDYNSDTLKRRRKFNWVRSNFMRKKTEKKMSYSQSELTSRYSNTSFDVPSGGVARSEGDHLRKSVSLEILPSATEDQEMSVQSNLHGEATQGYLRYVGVICFNLRKIVLNRYFIGTERLGFSKFSC